MIIEHIARKTGVFLSNENIIFNDTNEFVLRAFDDVVEALLKHEVILRKTDKYNRNIITGIIHKILDIPEDNCIDIDSKNVHNPYHFNIPSKESIILIHMPYYDYLDLCFDKIKNDYIKLKLG